MSKMHLWAQYKCEHNSLMTKSYLWTQNIREQNTLMTESYLRTLMTKSYLSTHYICEHSTLMDTIHTIHDWTHYTQYIYKHITHNTSMNVIHSWTPHHNTSVNTIHLWAHYTYECNWLMNTIRLWKQHTYYLLLTSEYKHNVFFLCSFCIPLGMFTLGNTVYALCFCHLFLFLNLSNTARSSLSKTTTMCLWQKVIYLPYSLNKCM